MIETSRQLLSPAFYTAQVEEAEYVRGDVQQSPATDASRHAELSLNLSVRLLLDNGNRPLLRLGARLRNTRNRGSRYSQLLKAMGIAYTPPGELDPTTLIGRRLYVRVEHASHAVLGVHLIVTELHQIPATARLATVPS